MVNDSAQIYTIEGVAAGILMVITAYLAVSSTTVLTPQDVHIIDMQLQQLGNDALAMMDSPDQYQTGGVRSYSPLTVAVMNNTSSSFNDQFLLYVNNATNIDKSGSDRLNYSASITYWNVTNQPNTISFYSNPYYRENAVKVTRWVYLPSSFNPALFYPGATDMRSDVNQSVLFEVLLWRE